MTTALVRFVDSYARRATLAWARLVTIRVGCVRRLHISKAFARPDPLVATIRDHTART
jgi:hypothetical protein